MSHEEIILEMERRERRAAEIASEIPLGHQPLTWRLDLYVTDPTGIVSAVPFSEAVEQIGSGSQLSTAAQIWGFLEGMGSDVFDVPL
jgi:hypothetical protein